MGVNEIPYEVIAAETIDVVVGGGTILKVAPASLRDCGRLQKAAQKIDPKALFGTDRIGELVRCEDQLMALVIRMALRREKPTDEVVEAILEETNPIQFNNIIKALFSTRAIDSESSTDPKSVGVAPTKS